MEFGLHIADWWPDYIFGIGGGPWFIAIYFMSYSFEIGWFEEVDAET